MRTQVPGTCLLLSVLCVQLLIVELLYWNLSPQHLLASLGVHRMGYPHGHLGVLGVVEYIHTYYTTSIPGTLLLVQKSHAWYHHTYPGIG